MFEDPFLKGYRQQVLMQMVYISTAQAHNYPVSGFQWHLERNAFEWRLPMILQPENAVGVTQNMANYFIRWAKDRVVFMDF
ncbi:gamma-glutamyl hydrolase 2-like isoform X2 [Elaeis guineensis]|uniref:gamma-glutamyl hydrolase 2-like isoform X2 n=1 Tax=Elaeis guineensis var. tenera TaxID=51953 RepID=UPI003C6D9305